MEVVTTLVSYALLMGMSAIVRTAQESQILLGQTAAQPK